MLKVISFDKSISYTKKIVNGEIVLPESFNPILYCGGLYSYKCTRENDIPIDHVGLSYLAYAQTIDSLKVLKVNDNGTLTKHFEETDDYSCLRPTSFMSNVTSDALDWYTDNEGNCARISKFCEKIINFNPFSNTKTHDIDSITGEDYREVALREGFLTGMREYVIFATNNGETELPLEKQESLTAFVNNQLEEFENCLTKIKDDCVEIDVQNIN